MRLIKPEGSTIVDSMATDVDGRDIAHMAALASRYDDLVTKDYAVFHTYHVEPYLDRLVQRLPQGTLLDVGCGTAVVGLAAASRGLDVVGIDHTQEMLDVAIRKAKELGLAERTRFQVGDATAMPFPDSSFDAVVCQRMLHHLPDMRPCLQEISRVLKPGGSFYIADSCRDVTPVKSTLINLKRSVVRKHSLSRLTDEAEEELPELLSEDEWPVSGEELVSTIADVGLEKDSLLFLTSLGYRSYLSESMTWNLIRLLSFPWRRSKGEMVFVTGTKPA